MLIKTKDTTGWEWVINSESIICIKPGDRGHYDIELMNGGMIEVDQEARDSLILTIAARERALIKTR